MTYQLVLASSSPRRKDLIDLLSIPYRIHPPEIDETLDEHLNLIEQCLLLAQKKAEKTKSDIILNQQRKDGIIILSADTLVEIHQKKLEKPKNINEAKEMLMLLSGKEHQVVTGLCIMHSQDQLIWHKEMMYSKTAVQFHTLSDTLIQYYVDTKDGVDKAGAYGIQGFAQSFIHSINGSYANVVGLPIDLVVQFLESKIATGKIHWKNLIV